MQICRKIGRYSYGRADLVRRAMSKKKFDVMEKERKNFVYGNEEEGVNEPDYKAMYEQMKAESRKWESRAKSNKEKADKWDAASNGSESVEDRIAKLEAENQAMREAEERHALIAKVVAETGLSEQQVARMARGPIDEDVLMADAKAYAADIEAAKPKGAPSAPEAGMYPHEEQINTKSNAQRFGDLIQEALGN